MRRGCLRFGILLAVFALALCANPASAQSDLSRLPPVDDSVFPTGSPNATVVESVSDSLWNQSTADLQSPADPGLPNSVMSGMRSLYGPIHGCDCSATHALVGLVAYESWRGVADDSWQNNGIHTGFNYGTRLGRFSELTGVGAQIGGTVGVYDWSGTDYRPASQQGQATTQGFLTYGLFRKSTADSRFNAGIVQDWMFVNNYGSFGQNVTMSQLRMQAGYATSDANEFGVWGTVRLFDQTRDIIPFGVGPTTFRPIDQVSFYWHYKWSPGGADTWLSVGVPEADRVAGGGSLGSWLVTLTANVPLSQRVAIYNSVTYMHPSAGPGALASEEDAWNFSIGMAFYTGRTARSNTVAGQCWLPQMQVANNGSFLVDAGNH